MKQLTALELRDAGYLQEVNRQFFHPLGLAMFVNVDTGEMGVYDERDDPEAASRPLDVYRLDIYAAKVEKPVGWQPLTNPPWRSGQYIARRQGSPYVELLEYDGDAEAWLDEFDGCSFPFDGDRATTVWHHIPGPNA